MNLVERIVRVLLAEEATFKCADCGAHGDAGSEVCPKCGSEEYYPEDSSDFRSSVALYCSKESIQEGEPHPGGQDLGPGIKRPWGNADCQCHLGHGDSEPCGNESTGFYGKGELKSGRGRMLCNDCAKNCYGVKESILREDVADTIFQQLRAASGAGGLGGLSRWGARDFIKSSDSLMFRVGRLGKVVIKYDSGPDSYTVSLWKLKGTGRTKDAMPEKLKLADDIYFDQLVEIIGDWMSEFNP